MGFFKSAKTYNVPQTTLERYVRSDKNPKETVNSSMGRKPVSSTEMEEELASYCLDMEKKFYALTRNDIKRLAFDLSRVNGIPNPFNADAGMAGDKWLSKFFKRRAELSFRTPQGVSAARIKSFTPEAVAAFFDIYEPELMRINVNSSRLYNCDETGISVVQYKHTKILARKEKRQVASLTSSERGSLITVVMCFSAAGHYVLPLIVFPRKNMKNELKQRYATGLNFCLPYFRMDPTRHLRPVATSFHSSCKTNERRSRCIGFGRPFLTYQEH